MRTRFHFDRVETDYNMQTYHDRDTEIGSSNKGLSSLRKRAKTVSKLDIPLVFKAGDHPWRRPSRPMTYMEGWAGWAGRRVHWNG